MTTFPSIPFAEGPNGSPHLCRILARISIAALATAGTSALFAGGIATGKPWYPAWVIAMAALAVAGLAWAGSQRLKPVITREQLIAELLALIAILIKSSKPADVNALIEARLLIGELAVGGDQAAISQTRNLLALYSTASQIAITGGE